MSSQLGFLASPHQQPGSAEAQKMTAGSGRNCLELYNLSSQHGASLRMFVASLVSMKDWCSSRAWLTWKVSATTHRRLLFQLAPSMPRTDEIESGLWQTPVSDDAVNRKKGKINSRGEPKLSAQVKMWATPDASVMNLNESVETVMERRARCKEKHGNNGFGLRLQTQVKMWPTPRSADADKNIRTHEGAMREIARKGGPQDLAQALRLWPTPTAAMGRAGSKAGSPRLERKKAQGWTIELHDMASSGELAEQSGQLNPQWVEWLMGYPVGWTDCEGSETQSCRK